MATMETHHKMAGSEETQSVLGDLPPEGTLHHSALLGEVDRLRDYFTKDNVHPDAADDSGRTPLMYAAIGNQTNCIELLVEAGANLHVCDPFGMASFHWAAQMGATKSFKLLMSRGADKTAKDINGRTPLILCTGSEGLACLTTLIKQLNQSQINDCDNEQMTALHWSAYNNATDSLKALLKAGADVVLCDKEGKTALHWTANNANATTATAILKAAPSIVNLQDTDGRTALHHAVAANNLSVVQALVTTPGVHCNTSAVDRMFRTPLHWAAVLGFEEMLHFLLEAGSNPAVGDVQGALPLHYASQRNHEGCVSLLVVRSDPNSCDTEGRTALMWAAGQGQAEVLNTLLEHGSDSLLYDKTGSTALHIAAARGHVECSYLLIQASSQLNALNQDQHTALFCAAEQGHSDVVVALLQEGAAVDLQDGDGRLALHWAASGGHSYICSALVQGGCPVDQGDLSGRTPLHCSCYGSHLECVKVLLELGANGNLPDNEGITPLHWACTSGDLATVQALVAVGVYLSPMEANGDKLTPLDYAIISGHQEVAQFLIDQGALSISGIEDLAVICIQKYYRGYKARQFVAHLRQQPGELRPQLTPEYMEGDRVSQMSEGDVRQSQPSVNRSRDIRARLQTTIQEKVPDAGKPVAVKNFQIGSGDKTEIARREKDRMMAYREKQKAALVIQLAWRKYVHRRRQRQLQEKQKEKRVFQVGGEEWRRELAALVIQLAWRQFLRRRLLKERVRRQRILHEWSPSVLAARQRALVDSIYSKEMKMAQYFPPKPKPMVRPAYMQYIPSPAAVSFNFAITQYQRQIY